jgi:hypothetical protein
MQECQKLSTNQETILVVYAFARPAVEYPVGNMPCCRSDCTLMIGHDFTAVLLCGDCLCLGTCKNNMTEQ